MMAPNLAELEHKDNEEFLDINQALQTLSVISSEPQFMEWVGRFTTALSDIK